MALFKTNYNKPGPGVPKNAPPKKGIARFIEILGRDFGNIIKLNLLVQLCWLPSQLLFALAALNFFWGFGTWFLILGALAAVAAIPVGPACTAQSYVLTKMLRDDPGFVWHDFKKAFKQNFKLTVVPGVLYAVVVGAQILGGYYYLFLGGNMSFAMLALLIMSVLFFAMASPYFFAQAPYVDLGAGPLIKNSILLALGNVPRSIAGALFLLVLSIGLIVGLPVTLPLVLLVGYALPMLITLMWVWPPVDKTFKISETLKRREAQRAQQDPDEEKAEEETEGTTD